MGHPTELEPPVQSVGQEPQIPPDSPGMANPQILNPSGSGRPTGLRPEGAAVVTPLPSGPDWANPDGDGEPTGLTFSTISVGNGPGATRPAH